LADGFDYREYLASDAWDQIRRKVWNRARNRCERCKERPVSDVHHLTYERIGHERMEDLIALCRPCHEAAHGSQKSSVRAHQERQIRKLYR
jgi:5-methylcytosine-specific restriction endonuclease McrA